jgi:eukaryotic-like serine/threonine-protein kinase
MNTPRNDTELARDATEVSAPRRPLPQLGGVETELDEGDRLGAWRLVRRLAKGGMGAVYLAERADGHFEQRAAIKLIRGVPSADMLVHFTRERQILATLQHPNIARLLDGGATPTGQPYLVMEYVEGEPIDAYCKAHALSLDARLRLFEEVCAAVQFAHQRLIVHCDLKPSNVLVRADGTPVLLDFGIAQAIDRRPGPSSIEAGYFTPGYASPEQLRGDAVATATDVYSLGLILFELIAGRKARTDAADHTVTLLGDAAVRPSELAADVPWRGRLVGDLDAIVLRATAFEPSARYASAEALADDIRCHLVWKPVAARAPTLPYLAGRLLRRRWPAFVAGVVGALMIAAFTWRLAAERDRALAAEREARVQQTAAERVSAFLVSVFDVSNPRLNQKRDVSARDVLDQGALRIEAELADQPRVKAKLLDTLATAYRYIGEPAKSIDLFRESVALHLDPRVNEPLPAAATLSQLAVSYANSGYSRQDAEAAARRSLELRVKNGGTPLDIGDAYNTLGIVLASEDRFGEADMALQKGLDLRRANGADATTIASSWHNLGMVASDRGEFDEALADYREALSLREKTIGEHNPEYQHTLTNYGVTLGRAGKTADAVPVLQKSLTLARELFGDDNDNIANVENELGSVFHDQGRFRDAIAHYREAMRINTRTLGENGAERAKPLNNLASAYEDMGDYVTAIPLFRESLEIRHKALSADDPMVMRANYNLGRVLTKAGVLKEAKTILDSVRVDFVERYGEENPSTAKAEMWLGYADVRLGNIDAAATLLDKLELSPAKFTPLMRAQRDGLRAEIAAARHDDATMLAARKDAWDQMRAGQGELHPLTAEVGIAYATALAQTGHAADARAVAEPLKAIVSEAFADNSAVRQGLGRWN